MWKLSLEATREIEKCFSGYLLVLVSQCVAISLSSLIWARIISFTSSAWESNLRNESNVRSMINDLSDKYRLIVKILCVFIFIVIEVQNTIIENLFIFLEYRHTYSCYSYPT